MIKRVRVFFVVLRVFVCCSKLFCFEEGVVVFPQAPLGECFYYLLFSCLTV